MHYVTDLLGAGLLQCGCHWWWLFQFTATAACAAVILCKHVLLPELVSNVDAVGTLVISASNDLGDASAPANLKDRTTFDGVVVTLISPLVHDLCQCAAPRSATANVLGRKHRGVMGC
jgi:hypothetical protein